MSGNWKSKAEVFAKNLAEQASGLAEKSKQKLDDSGATAFVSEKATSARKFLDEKGVTEKVASASEKVGEHLDIVSGQTQLQLVEQHLELQNELNDILATKLEEALIRIAALEARLDGK